MDDRPQISRPPSTEFDDACGRRIRLDPTISARGLSESGSLREMYLDLDGRCRAMGVPPVREDELLDWLDALEKGLNIVAWHGDDIIGHAIVLPDGQGSHELAIFVHQDYQNAGIGTALCQTIIAEASESGISRIWLSVARGNSPAKTLFRSVGFEVVDRSNRQLTMEMRLG